VFLLEARDVRGRPLGERDLAVLLLLAGLGPLDADPGVVAEPDPLPVLVVVDRLVGLVERAPAAERALLLAERLQVAVGAQAVAQPDGALPLVERAGPDRVHTGQALREPAVADGAQRVHALHDDGRGEERAPARLPGVVLVQVEGGEVADREREVVDRVARHLGAPRAASREALPDAGAEFGDALVGDAAVLRVSHGASVDRAAGAARAAGARSGWRARWAGRRSSGACTRSGPRPPCHATATVSTIGPSPRSRTAS